MAIITVSRDYGSFGCEIAAQVARNMNFTYIDRALIERLSGYAGVKIEDIQYLDETVHHKEMSTVESFIVKSISNVFKIPINEGKILDEKGYFSLLRQVIHNIYKTEDVVLVGRGCNYILEGMEKIFRVRITASEDTLIDRTCRHDKVDRFKAQALVKGYAECRTDFVKTYFHHDINNCADYDMILNTDHLTVEQAVDIICCAADKYLYHKK